MLKTAKAAALIRGGTQTGGRRGALIASVLNIGLAASLGLSTPALASTTVNFGPTSPAPVNDTTPSSTPTLQTVYGHTQFGSSPVTISAIDFFLGNTSISNTQTYTITLSTSANPVGSLSSTFADNLGADAAVFYTGVPGAPAYPGTWVSFSGTDFLYDPSLGDLLVQITHPLGDDRLYSSYDGGISDAQRVYTLTDGATTGTVNSPGYAMVARFTLNAASVTAVPEPSTWAMMLLGLGGIGFVSRRGKRGTRVFKSLDCVRGRGSAISRLLFCATTVG